MLKDIGTILVEQKILTKDQLEKFMSESKAENKPVGQYLEEKKIIKAEDLAKAYAAQLSVPFIEKVTEEMANPELLGKIPFKFLRDNVIIPIKLNLTNNVLWGLYMILKPFMRALTGNILRIVLTYW